MDADLWSSRLAAAKRHHALQSYHYQWDCLSADDFEADDNGRPECVCPYCYEDFEISALCTHLEEEHMYESKGVACPVCAAKISKDVVGHLTYQHAHLFNIQRRRRFRRSGVPPGSTLSSLGKELREAHLQASGSVSNATESFLSSLALNISLLEAEDSSKQTQFVEDVLSNTVSLPTQQHTLSFEASLSAEEREQKLKHATIQSKFVQQLLLSTMLGRGN